MKKDKPINRGSEGFKKLPPEGTLFYCKRNKPKKIVIVIKGVSK